MGSAGFISSTVFVYLEPWGKPNPLGLGSLPRTQQLLHGDVVRVQGRDDPLVSVQGLGL